MTYVVCENCDKLVEKDASIKLCIKDFCVYFCSKYCFLDFAEKNNLKEFEVV
jgi:hypothetical protein